MKIKDLLKVLEIGAWVEIYDKNSNLIVKASTHEVLLHDEGLLDKDILEITPQHNARENYIEIMVKEE